MTNVARAARVGGLGRGAATMLAFTFGFAPLLAGGCYHYRVQPANSAPADELRRDTRHAFFWGTVQTPSVTPDCQGNGVAEVHASTNLAYALATIVSLGIWAPLDVEWRCAKDRVRVEREFGDGGVAER